MAATYKQFINRISSQHISVMKLWVKNGLWQFTGLWYTAAVYASDGRITYDCSILDFQEDNLGYTMRESFVEVDNGDRIQKSYFSRIDSITNTSDKEARYIISHTENGEPNDITNISIFLEHQ